MKRASKDDVPLLLSLMEEFYTESGYELDRAVATAAFESLLADDSFGYVWIIQDRDQDVGHLVLTLKFTMEHAGIIACIDDLYVRPAHRNRGLSTGALLQVRSFCESSGIRALTVEVAPDNGPAQTVYRRLGLTEAPGRQLLALPLAPPSHAI